MQPVLPSSLRPDTTDDVGYFESPPHDLATWLASSLGPDWTIRSVEGAFADLLQEIGPAPDRTRFLLLPLGGWSCVMTNGPGGTDLGVIPSYAVRELGCRVIRAASIEPVNDRYYATILEVYSEEAGDDPQRCRRALYAANDGGRWDFGNFGDQFEFEEVSAYARRRVRDRFTGDMLQRYLVELGVARRGFAAEDEFPGSYIVERAPRADRSYRPWWRWRGQHGTQRRASGRSNG